MEDNRSQIVVSVIGEKTSVNVINKDNEASILVGLDPAPIKVFIGNTNSDYPTVAEIERMLQEHLLLPGTYYDSMRLGGFMWHEYPRKKEDAIISGNWRHTGTLALGGNFTAQAPLHNIGKTLLSGVIEFGDNILSNDNPVGGFGGSGFIYNFNQGHLTLDNLTVRKAMRVYELIINQIRGTNGSLWVSDTVKIKSAEETPLGWKCFIDTGDSDAIVPFVPGDVVRAQRWTGKGVHYYSSYVIETATEYFVLDKARWDGWDFPMADDVLVRMGNEDANSGRQGALYLTSSDDNSPYLDVIDGVDGFSLAGKTKVRLGRLDGLYYNGDQLSGYGLYSDRALLTGAIRNLNGQWALNEDGSGVLAGGAISWTKGGVITFGNRGIDDYATTQAVEEIIGEQETLNVNFENIPIKTIEALEVYNTGLISKINDMGNRKNTRYVSETEPVLPEGETFRIGDEWMKENKIIDEVTSEVSYEYTSYMWFGTSWEENLTVIDGARITTGIIDAQRIIAKELFAQEIGAVKLNVVRGFIGGFNIDDSLSSETAEGTGISISPSERKIWIKDFKEGLGVSQVVIRAGSLSSETELITGGGQSTYVSKNSSINFNVRKGAGDPDITSNNTRASNGVTIRMYIGEDKSIATPKIESTTPDLSNSFTLAAGKNYTSDMPFQFEIHHSGGRRNSRNHKLHGDLVVSVKSKLIGLTSTGAKKELTDFAINKIDISRSTNSQDVYKITTKRKVSFYNADCIRAFWELDVNIKGNLTYQQWTNQGFWNYYWMTSTGFAIDYQAAIPPGLSFNPSAGITEITTSGMQMMWSAERFLRINGEDSTYFIQSNGDWIHHGKLMLGTARVVTSDTIMDDVDLSAYATKNYMEDNYYNKTLSDGKYYGKTEVYNRTESDGRYLREDKAAVITGAWQFRGALQSRNADNTNIYTELNTNASGSYIQLRDATGQVRSIIRGYSYNNFLDSIGIGISSAPSERLHVAGNGLFTGNFTAQKGTLSSLDVSGISTLTGAATFKNYIGSESWTSGFTGTNTWRLETGSETHLTVDRLTVRGRMDVYELVINQIRATNGSLWVSDAIKIISASRLGGWENKYIQFDFDSDDNKRGCPFLVGDIVRAQKFDGRTIVRITGRVYQIFNNKFRLTTDTFQPDFTGDLNILSGLEFVRIGNINSSSNRQGSLYLTSSDNGAPYLDVLDGVNTGSFAGKTKVRLGRLNGINNLSGYGLYGENTFLTNQLLIGDLTKSNNYMEYNPVDGLTIKGKITVTGGNVATKQDLDDLEIGGRNLARGNTGELRGYTPSTVNNATYNYASVYPEGLEIGDWVTISIDIIYSNVGYQTGTSPNMKTQGAVDNAWRANPFASALGHLASKITGTDGKVHISNSFQVTESAINGTKYNIGFRCDYSNGVAKYEFKNLMVTKGKKDMLWTPAPEDVTAEIATAKQEALTAASAAQTTANTANATVGNLNAYVDGAFKDGVINAAEAKAIEKYKNTLNEAMAKTESSYLKVYTNTYLSGAPKTALQNAKINLWGQRDTLISAINIAISGGTTTAAQKLAVDNAFTSFNSLMSAFQNALEEANKAIQVKLDNISKGYVDDLEIGGRNLALETNKGAKNWTWSSQNTNTATISSVIDRHVDTVLIQRNSSAVGSWAYIAYNAIQPQLWLPDTSYVVSIYVKASIATTIQARIMIGNATLPFSDYVPADRITVVGKWVNLIFKFKTYSTLPAVGSQVLYLAVNSGPNVSYQIKDLIITQGNKGVPWSPAPEDVPSALDYLATAIQDGSTDIEGGLVSTNVLMVKDTSGAVTGGMSGLSNDNVGFWTGGTYQAAQGSNPTAGVVFRKDGSFSLGNGKITGTAAGVMKIGNIGIYENHIGVSGGTSGVTIDENNVIYKTSNNDKIVALGSESYTYIRQDSLMFLVNKSVSNRTNYGIYFNVSGSYANYAIAGVGGISLDGYLTMRGGMNIISPNGVNRLRVIDAGIEQSTDSGATWRRL